MDARSSARCTTWFKSIEQIHVIPTHGAATVPLTEGYGGDLEPSIAPHGDRLIFSSSRGGNRHIWTAALDGTDQRPLTSGESFDEHPSVSPDGQEIAFVSDRGGQRAIWQVGLGGGAPHKLTETGVIGGLSWSPDGHQIVFSAAAGEGLGLWTVSIPDGAKEASRYPRPWTSRLSLRGAQRAT